MIKLNNLFKNKEFLDFIGVSDFQVLEFFEEEKLYNLIKTFNDEHKNKINFIYIFTDTEYITNEERHLDLTVELYNDDQMEIYKVKNFNNANELLGDPEIDGPDFLNLNDYFENDYPFELFENHLNYKEQEKAAEKYFEEKELDILISNRC